MLNRKKRTIEIQIEYKKQRLSVVELQIRKHRNPGKYKKEKDLILSEIEKMETLINAMS